MTEPQTLLVLPRLEVRNANAIAGPFSWGFPAPSAFTGFVHALERRLSGYRLGGVGIICHDFQVLTHRPNRRSHQVFALTRNPIDKDGSTAAIVEEGRMHMEISLLIDVHEYEGKTYIGEDDRSELKREVQRIVQGMRLAGGSILPLREDAVECRGLSTDPEGQRQDFRKLRRQLMPGYALVQREDLLIQHLAELRQSNETAHALDALLDLYALHFEPPQSATEAEDEPHEDTQSVEDTAEPAISGKFKWAAPHKRRPGWLVPLPIGYAGISELYPPGQVANARDAATPFRFVEALYSLGQWISPHRIDNLSALLWHTETDRENGLYRCVNRYAETLAK
jgi:CRISPR-associated protein Csy2